jgi:hypothetical protein
VDRQIVTVRDTFRRNIKTKKNNFTHMKTYRIIKLSTNWSTSSLTKAVEQLLNAKTKEGYEIVTVAFGVNMWWMPTAYITICRTIN